ESARPGRRTRHHQPDQVGLKGWRQHSTNCKVASKTNELSGELALQERSEVLDYNFVLRDCPPDSREVFDLIDGVHLLDRSRLMSLNPRPSRLFWLRSAL